MGKKKRQVVVRWIHLPQLQSHFPSAAPPNNAEKYPYRETVHPEDLFSVDMGKRKHSKEDAMQRAEP